MDTPYRVEDGTTREWHGNVSVWLIKRNSETLCRTKDATFAYRIVELLNRDEQAERQSTRMGR